MTTLAKTSDAASIGRRMLNKVPEVTLWFWVIKIMCTTVGETASEESIRRVVEGCRRFGMIIRAEQERAEA